MSRKSCAALARALNSCSIWPLLAAWPKCLAIEIDDGQRLDAEGVFELAHGDLGPLRHVGHVEHEMRARVVLARAFDEIEHVLGVAQIGEIGHGRDDDLIGLQQHVLLPRRPGMWEIDRHVGHVLAHDVDDGLAGLGRKIVVAVEDDRRGKDGQMFGAHRQKAIEQHLVEPLRCLQGVGDALHGILIEVEAGGAEGEIEIGDDDVRAQRLRKDPGDVVADRRGADTALGAGEGKHVADRVGARIVVEPGQALHEIERRDWSHEVLRHATLQELAIENDVVHGADNDHLRALIAVLGKLIELGQKLGRRETRFKNDKIGCRVLLIVGHGGRSRHPSARSRALCSAAVLGRGLNHISHAGLSQNA